MKKILHKIVICLCCAAILGNSVPVVLADGESSSAVSSAPEVSAKTVVLIDAQTMQIFYQKDMHAHMYPASITKIMAGLLAVEGGKPDDLVTVNQDVGNSQGKSVACIGLLPGEQLTQDSLMYSMFLASANDSAYVLAEHIGGTVGNFVDMMNYRAKQLGTTDTHFDNPNGLPDKNNYTSAYDMALIAIKAVSTPEELKYFGAVKQTIPADNKRPSMQFGTIVNMLRPDSMYHYDGIIAAKSGWIEMSGYTLVTAAKRDGRTLISVQMGGDSWPSVYKDAISLFNYGFAQPENIKSDTALVSLSSGKASLNEKRDSPVFKVITNKDTFQEKSYKIPLVIFTAIIFSLSVLAVINFKTRKKRKSKIF